MRHANNRPLSSIGAVVLMGLAALITPVSAEDSTLVEAQTLARDAYIYGFPVVENYKKMYAYAIDKEGKQYKTPFNTLKNEANVVTPANRSNGPVMMATKLDSATASFSAMYSRSPGSTW